MSTTTINVLQNASIFNTCWYIIIIIIHLLFQLWALEEQTEITHINSPFYPFRTLPNLFKLDPPLAHG